MAPTGVAAPSAPPRSSRQAGRGPSRRWAATCVVCLGLFLLGMDLTVLNVAIPDLQRDLHSTMAQVQWVVDGYALLLGGTVLATGAVTDRIGRRRAFTAGLLLCATASALGALAHSPLQVIAARGGMGLGAALLMPATLSIISNLFPEPGLRRRAIAFWTAVAGAGGLAGPVIGGWLVEYFSWRAGFWINLPVAATAVLLALWLVPESRAPHAERADLLGSALSAAGLLALVWAVIESPDEGWASPPVLAAFAAAALLLAAFAAWQLRCPHPMLPPLLLRDPRIGVGATVLALTSFALFGTLFVITLYLQHVLGYTPWQAGVRTLPLPAGLAAGAAAALPLTARCGERACVVAGLSVVTGAFAVLARTQPDSGYGRLALFQLVAGLGAGLVAAAGTEAVMGAVPRARAGLGSAVNDATRQVGSALGVAVQGSLLTSRYTDRLEDLLVEAHAPDALLKRAQDGVPGTAEGAHSAALPPQLRTQVLDATREAFTGAMTDTAYVGAAVALAAAAAAWRWLPRRAAPAEPASGTGPPPPRRSPAERA